MHAPGAALDEGLLLVYPEQLLQGAVPQRDFETAYGPATYWPLAALYWLAGAPSVSLERAVGLLYLVLIALAIAALAGRGGRTYGIAAGVMAVLCLAPLGVLALPWFGAAAATLWSIWLLTRPPAPGGSFPVGVPAAGVLAAVAITYRPELAIVVLASGAAALAGRPRGAGISYAGGFVIAALPLLVHVIMAGPGAVIANEIAAPLAIRPGRALPIPPRGGLNAALFGTVIICALLNAGAALAALRAHLHQPGGPQTAVPVGALSLMLLPQLLQRADYAHIGEVASIAVSMLPVSVQILAGSVRPIRSSAARFAIPVALVLLLVITFRGYWWPRERISTTLRGDLAPAHVVHHGGRWWPAGSATDATDLEAVLADADRAARPGQRLVVGPGDLRRTSYGDTFIYFLLPRLRPGTYFLEMSPGTANAPGSRLASDLRAAQIVILNTAWDAWNEPNASAHPGPAAPNEVIATLFCRVSTHGTFELFVRGPCASVSG